MSRGPDVATPGIRRTPVAADHFDRARRVRPDIPSAKDDTEASWWRLHAWTLAATFAILLTGMAFSFWWFPLVDHYPAWFTPTDLWSTYRDAQYVGWSGEGVLYNAGTFLETLPGIAVALAPLAALAGALHLSESFPLALLRPSAWYLLGPANLLLGALLLFPLDAIARRVSVTPTRRVTLTWLCAVLIWPVVAEWGHPEDLVALAFALYGLMATSDEEWFRVGCFFGLAIVFQPLAVVLFPLALSRVPARKWLPVLVEAGLPSGILLIAPLVQQWRATTTYLVKQPSFIGLNHTTPWAYLAPVISPARTAFVKVAEKTRGLNGVDTLHEVTRKVIDIEIVAAGPERIIALAIACTFGVWVGLKRPPLVQVLWFAAAALCLRCLVECVVDSYYLAPGALLAILVASTLSTRRFATTVAAAGLATWATYWYTSPWHYYLAITVLIVVLLACSAPFVARDSANRRPPMSAFDPRGTDDSSPRDVARPNPTGHETRRLRH